MDDKLTPPEIEALIKSGDLTEEDLYIIPQEYRPAAAVMMADAGKVEVMGNAIPPPMAVGALGGGLSLAGAGIKKAGSLLGGMGELGGEMAGAMAGSAMGHPIIGMLLGRAGARGLSKWSRRRPPTPPSPKPSNIDRVTPRGKSEPNTMGREGPHGGVQADEMPGALPRPAGPPKSTPPAGDPPNLIRSRSAADEEHRLRSSGADQKAVKRSYHEAGGAQKKGVKVEGATPTRRRTPPRTSTPTDSHGGPDQWNGRTQDMRFTGGDKQYAASRAKGRAMREHARRRKPR